MVLPGGSVASLDPDSRMLSTLDLRPPMLGFCFQGFSKAHVPVRAGVPPPEGRGPRASGQQPPKAGGWPRKFTIGRARSAGTPALSHTWRDAALPPLATGRRWRAAPRSSAAETRVAGRRGTEVEERGAEGWLVHSSYPWLRVRRSVCSGVRHRASQGRLRLMSGHVRPDTAATELRWEDRERAVAGFQPRHRAAAVELMPHITGTATRGPPQRRTAAVDGSTWLRRRAGRPTERGRRSLRSALCCRRQWEWCDGTI